MQSSIFQRHEDGHLNLTFQRTSRGGNYEETELQVLFDLCSHFHDDADFSMYGTGRGEKDNGV